MRGSFRQALEMERLVRESRMLGDAHTDLLAKLADVSSLRAKVHAANIANQNTPGYQAQRVAFEAKFHQALSDMGAADDVDPEIVPAEGLAAQADGNNVSVDREVLEQAQNNTLYNAYLGMLQGRKKLMTIAISSTPGG
jgi:flagellar basal-body rod protein FlgB